MFNIVGGDRRPTMIDWKFLKPTTEPAAAKIPPPRPAIRHVGPMPHIGQRLGRALVSDAPLAGKNLPTGLGLTAYWGALDGLNDFKECNKAALFGISYRDPTFLIGTAERDRRKPTSRMR
jgi:hypothetical protein